MKNLLKSHQYCGLWLVLALLSGCASIGPEAALRSVDRVTVYGANPQFDNPQYEMVDLITALDPEGYRNNFRTPLAAVQKEAVPQLFSTSSLPGPSDTSNDATTRTELALAFKAFYDTRYTSNGSVALRRNRLQDRLIAASNQRCEAYKVYLRRFEAYQETGWGIASTAAGGVAAIVGGLKDARILGGLAGIFGGVRAEIKQGMLGNLASYIIIPGIDQRRSEVMAEIRGNQTNPNYTVESALSDVASYHGACSLETGLEQAKNAIQIVENPGMQMMGKVMNNVMQTRYMASISEKVGTPGGVKQEEWQVPTFSMGGAPMISRTLMRHGAPTNIASTETDASATVQQAGSTARAMVDEMRVLALAHAKVLQTDMTASTSTSTVSALTALKTGLTTTATAALSAITQTITASVSASFPPAALADACIAVLENTANFESAAEKKAAAQKLLDEARITVDAELTKWASIQSGRMNYWQQVIKDAMTTYMDRKDKVTDASSAKASLDKLLATLAPNGTGFTPLLEIKLPQCPTPAK